MTVSRSNDLLSIFLKIIKKVYFKKYTFLQPLFLFPHLQHVPRAAVSLVNLRPSVLHHWQSLSRLGQLIHVRLSGNDCFLIG